MSGTVAIGSRAEKPQFLALTGLRFVLAGWVILFHQAAPKIGYIGEWMLTAPPLVFHSIRAGYVAVQVFFLLSGFILAYNYPLDGRWKRKSISRFFAARFARIYPAYLLGLILISPFILTPLVHDIRLASVFREGGKLILNLLFLQAWIPQMALTWNFPGWSLSNEAFFYAVFPFLGVYFWRLLTARRLCAIAMLIYIMALAAPSVATIFDVGGSKSSAEGILWDNFFKFEPLLQLPSFMFGILVAWIYRRLWSRRDPLVGRGYLIYLPALATELAIILGLHQLPVIFFHNGLLLPLHAAVILGLALGGGWVDLALSCRPMVFMGGASYLMYLMQIPVAQWLNLVAKHVFHAAPKGLIYCTFYLFVVVSFSAVVFVKFEIPAHQRLRRLISGGSGATAFQPVVNTLRAAKPHGR